MARWELKQKHLLGIQKFARYNRYDSFFLRISDSGYSLINNDYNI